MKKIFLIKGVRHCGVMLGVSLGFCSLAWTNYREVGLASERVVTAPHAPSNDIAADTAQRLHELANAPYTEGLKDAIASNAQRSVPEKIKSSLIRTLGQVKAKHDLAQSKTVALLDFELSDLGAPTEEVKHAMAVAAGDDIRNPRFANHIKSIYRKHGERAGILLHALSDPTSELHRVLQGDHDKIDAVKLAHDAHTLVKTYALDKAGRDSDIDARVDVVMAHVIKAAAPADKQASLITDYLNARKDKKLSDEQAAIRTAQLKKAERLEKIQRRREKARQQQARSVLDLF